MFKIHMGGHLKPVTYMFGSGDKGLLGNFNNREIIGESTDDHFSVIKLDSGKFWVFINTPVFKTIMLTDEHGDGCGACYTHHRPGNNTMDLVVTHTAVDLGELEVDDETKFYLVASIQTAMTKMMANSILYQPSMECSKEEMEDVYQSLYKELEVLDPYSR